MTIKPKDFLLPFLICFITGCDWLTKSAEEPEGEPIARVYDKYLYEKNLADLKLKGLSPEDSAKIVNEYIENWVRHNLMLSYAQENLPEDKLDIERQIQDYRESLIIYNYEKEYIDQQLDTVIEYQQIEEFYRNNLSNFRLSSDIYRLQYLKLVNDSPKLDSVKMWMKSNKAEDEERLRDYAFQYAVDFNMNDSMWIDTRTADVVVPNVNKVTVSDRGYFELTDSPFVYLGKILDTKIKETPAPLTYVRPDIEKIILNRRKMQLLKNLNTNIYEDAARKDKFEIYQK